MVSKVDCAWLQDRGRTDLSVGSLRRKITDGGKLLPTKNVYLFVSIWFTRSSEESLVKQVSATLLAAGFVLFALISLLTAIRSSESTSSVLINHQEKVSDIGLRFAFKR
jgi:hypothetical protein